MKIVYNTETNAILSSINSNSETDSFSVKKMFPDYKENVSFIDIDISPFFKVVGGKIHFKSGIANKITKNDDVIFQLSEEEFNKNLEKFNKESKKKLLMNFPCNCSKGSVSLFLDKISKSFYTKDYIKKSLNDGSYFNDRIYKVGWWGSFTDAGGYACMNRSIISRLHNYHIIPYIKMYPTIPQVEAQVADILNCYSDLSPKKGQHPFIYAYTPMSHEYHGGKRIFFTMFETATLHPVFVDYCNRFSDEIWVPSKANRNVFLSSGIRKLIRVVPLGIDETLYLQNPTKRDFSGYLGLYGQSPEKGLKNFKFVTVIQWNFRKGFDALIKSFVNSFSEKDDVCLVITTQYSRETVLNDLNQFLPRSDNLPQVVLYNHIIPTIDMPAYYRQFDCYVHFSRGEGFSLTQIEAASCGLPVISSYHSGMTEYLTEENSFPIICNELEKSCSRLNAVCFYYQDQMMWKLGKAQIDSAIEYMRYVKENYEMSKRKSEVFLSEIKDSYTWDKVTERVSNIITEL